MHGIVDWKLRYGQAIMTRNNGQTSMTRNYD
jgi:hypothetical protein